MDRMVALAGKQLECASRQEYAGVRFDGCAGRFTVLLEFGRVVGCKGYDYVRCHSGSRLGNCDVYTSDL